MSEDINPQPEAQPASIPYFCPACGTLLRKEYVDGILCWVCPEGDYWEPINP